MSSYNFLPSVNSINFLRSQTHDSTLHNLNNFTGVFEVGLEIEIGGLNYLIEPMEKKPVPFYLTIVTYTQNGGIGKILHGFRSVEYTGDRIVNGDNEDQLFVFITKFRDDEKFDELQYDFVTNAFIVKILYSNEKIETPESLENYLYEPFYVLFETKLPYVDFNRRHNGEGNV